MTPALRLGAQPPSEMCVVRGPQDSRDIYADNTQITSRSTFYDQLIVLELHIYCVSLGPYKIRETHTHIKHLVLGVR